MRRWLTTIPETGQPRRRIQCRLRLLAGLACLAGLVSLAGPPGCHRPPGPFDPDPRLPEAFRTPEVTFQTWRAASLAADARAVRGCYWSGLLPEEAEAYLARDLRPETQRLLSRARWLGIEPRTPVEVIFRLADSAGQELRGVMVRTAAGWKLQHW